MPDAIALVKFANRRFFECLYWDDVYIRHFEDRSDGLDQPYHFSPDDRWIPRVWRVGDVLDCRRGNTLRRTADEGRTWSVRPWAYTMTLVAAFARYPCGGDIGDAAVMVVEYDPTWSLDPRRGFVENHWYAKDIGSDDGWGWWRWQSFRLGQAPGFGPPTGKNIGQPEELNSQALIERIQRRRRWMTSSIPIGPLAAEGDALIDVQFHTLGGTRVTPIQPVRPWTVKPPEEPVPTPTQYDEDFLKGPVKTDILADYAEANKPLDDFYPVWFARTAYDMGAKGMTKEASWQKHRNGPGELRESLGLKPIPPQ